MPERKTKKRHRVMMSLSLPMSTRLMLDDLVRVFEEYRPQVAGLPFGKVNRSIIVRCAVAYLRGQAECGNVGPEILTLAQNERPAHRPARRKVSHEETPLPEVPEAAGTE
jgi:hypothetical protein